MRGFSDAIISASGSNLSLISNLTFILLLLLFDFPKGHSSYSSIHDVSCPPILRSTEARYSIDLDVVLSTQSPSKVG